MTTIMERYAEMHAGSQRLHARASKLFPDGVTHDIRRLLPFPIYVTDAMASRKCDVDGNDVIDYVMGHGALLLGHQHPEVTAAVLEQAARGTHYGASHEMEIRWGELVRRLVPSAEKLRFTSSGTEATMMAVRLARAHTGREKLLRLREHFHGWNDSVTGQPAPEETVPVSPGVPRGFLDTSLVIPQNDVAALERTVREDGGAIAAAIFEPTGAHWGTEPISIDYVRRLRELTAEHGIVLIFDEVITGFRVSPGGAQQAYGITPDMTTMAKILGGGLPGGAVAGRADILDQIAMGAGQDRRTPGRVEHPGTYNANPLSAAAGSACLRIVEDGTHQERAAHTAADIGRKLNGILREESITGCVYGESSMLHVALGMSEQPPDGYSWGWQPLPCPAPPVAREVALGFRLGMLNEGIDLMGDGFMVSSAHTAKDVADTADAFRRTLRAMKAERLV